MIKTLEQVEKEHILHVRSLKNGNRVETAKALRISLRQLDRKMRIYDIPYVRQDLVKAREILGV